MFCVPNLDRIKSALGIQRGLPITAVFAPDSPVWEPDAFVTRRALVAKLIRLLQTKSAQPLLYGEAGVGKTSLGLHCLHTARMAYRRYGCTHVVSLERLLAENLDSLSGPTLWERHSAIAGVKGGRGGISLGVAALQAQAWSRASSKEVRRPWSRSPSVDGLVSALAERSLVLFIDDIERGRDPGFIDALGEIAKHLAEYSKGSTAKCLFSIAVEDPTSFPREFNAWANRIHPVAVPRMTGDEIRAIVVQGMLLTLLRLSVDVVDRIAELAEGLPRRAKQLCSDCGCIALEGKGQGVTRLTGGEMTIDLGIFRERIEPLTWSEAMG